MPGRTHTPRAHQQRVLRKYYVYVPSVIIQ